VGDSNGLCYGDYDMELSDVIKVARFVSTRTVPSNPVMSALSEASRSMNATSPLDPSTCFLAHLHRLPSSVMTTTGILKYHKEKQHQYILHKQRTLGILLELLQCILPQDASVPWNLKYCSQSAHTLVTVPDTLLTRRALNALSN